MTGAAIVALAMLLGMAAGAHHHLDGAQTGMVCLLAWLILSSLYHGAVSFLSFFGVRRRRGRR